MIKKMFARWAFTKEVRASIARTLDKLSWMGLAVFTAAGLAMHSWAVAIATALWFALFRCLPTWCSALRTRKRRQDRPPVTPRIRTADLPRPRKAIAHRRLEETCNCSG